MELPQTGKQSKDCWNDKYYQCLKKEHHAKKCPMIEMDKQQEGADLLNIYEEVNKKEKRLNAAAFMSAQKSFT